MFSLNCCWMPKLQCWSCPIRMLAGVGVMLGGDVGPRGWPRKKSSKARCGTELALLNSVSCSERSEEHTSELQSHLKLVCRLLVEKKRLDERDRAQLVGAHRGAGDRYRRAGC